MNIVKIVLKTVTVLAAYAALGWGSFVVTGKILDHQMSK